MIQKLFSNALLLMIMDKKARSKFKIILARKRHLNVFGQSINQLFMKLKGKEVVKINMYQKIIGLDGAYKKQPTPVPPQQSNDNPGSTGTEILIRKAGETAKQNVTKSDKKPKNKNRKALIEEAMAMRKAKSHILDQLDQEQLRKLSILVGKALVDPNAEE